MTTPEPRRAAILFILFTVLLDVLALGLIIPVLPQLILDFRGGDTSEAAATVGVFGTVWALMQFAFSSMQGSLADRFGRRPVILLSNLGLGLDYLLMALAPSLGWLLVGRIVSGITAASFSTAGAYIADVTPPEKRAAAFGKIGAAFGVGFIVGPAIGGLLGGFDPRMPFWFAAVLSLANFAYGFFVLPESLPPERRTPFSWAKANPIGSLQLLRSRPGLMGLVSVAFFYHVAHSVYPSVFVLYAKHRYGWGERGVGLTLAVAGVCSAVVQGGLVGVLVKRLGERRAMLLGLASGVVGMAAYGWAPTGPLFFVGIPIIALWGITNPSVQALLTPRVGPTEQGKLQGALSGVMSIAGIIGPLLFSHTFAYFLAPDAPMSLPGAPFFLASFFLGVSFIVAWLVTRGMAGAVLPVAARDATVSPPAHG
ncbi:MAG: TCR/Tet family MFS transporter [Archangium sp.]|nr:TCR/Tet family MFS transporter [Archangium sp.]